MGYSYGGSYADISVDVGDAVGGLDDFNVRAKRALRKYLEQEACPMLVDYMVSNHPWENRTRTAEKGLVAKVDKTGNMKRTDWNLELYIAHTAYHNGFPYGMSLEFGSYPNPRTGGHNKPYPILSKTKERMFPKVIEDMEGVLDYYG